MDTDIGVESVSGELEGAMIRAALVARLIPSWCLRVLLCAVLVLGAFPERADAQTVRRDLNQWLAAQGTFCVPNGSGGCFLFFSPLPNMLGWQDETNNRCALVDYAGLANNRYLKPQGRDLGTTVTGTVTERRLSDGKAEITVRLQVTNALTFAVTGCDLTAGPLIFGYRAQEILTGAPPSLADASFVAKYTVASPGLPLTDLIEVAFFPELGTNLISAHFDADTTDGRLRAASGFPEGTLGTLSIKELGLFKPRGTAGAPFVVHRITFAVQR
jgi:hypothetical protein